MVNNTMASSPQPKRPRGEPAGYQPVYQDEEQLATDGTQAEDDAGQARPPGPSKSEARFRTTTYVLAVFLVILVGLNVYLSLPLAFPRDDSCPCRPKDVPQYFQTSPELWAGPTATGRPAFMAQTRTFDPTGTYVPNEPLQTSIPIEGMSSANTSIFKMMGFLSPYSPSPGFGVDEYPIPSGAEIVQVQMLSRHGSRYPTMGSDVLAFGERIANASGTLKLSGNLGFLNDWKYQLGHEILVPKGREELFQSGEMILSYKSTKVGQLTSYLGILHSYMYGSLYNPQSKIIVRTTVSSEGNFE